MSELPRSASGAFTQASAMADELDMTLTQLCIKAKQQPSTVFRWHGRMKSYSVIIYGDIEKTYQKLLKEKQKEKRRPKSKK